MNSLIEIDDLGVLVMVVQVYITLCRERGRATF